MAVVTGQILSRFETVIQATPGTPHGGFRKANTRFDLAKTPEGARDGVFRCEAVGIDTARQVFGTGEVVRNMGAVAVQVAYFRGGGSMGGYAAGGDRKNVNKRVLDDIFALVAACEASATYDELNTGIRVVKFESFARVADLDRSEIWQILFNVEWTAVVVTS